MADSIEARVRSIVAGILCRECADIRPGRSLGGLHVRAIDRLRIAWQMEDRFAIKISNTEAADWVRVADIHEMLDRKLAKPAQAEAA